MNKIIVNKESYNLQDEEIEIINKSSNLVLNVFGNVVINDFNDNQDSKLIINVNEDSKLTINRFNSNINKISIDINVSNNAMVIFNQSIYQAIDKALYEVNTNILGNNNNIKVNVYGVSNNNGSLVIKANGDVKKNIKDNEMLENVRILTLNDEINTIIPNLLVSSEEVMVNHNATISGLDKNYLFYLMGKGLSIYSASKLIVNGFINHHLNLKPEEYKKIEF